MGLLLEVQCVGPSDPRLLLLLLSRKHIQQDQRTKVKASGGDCSGLCTVCWSKLQVMEVNQ